MHISIPVDMFREVEKRMKYRFWDRERMRSNRAKYLADAGMARPNYAAVCLRQHETMAWVGPPHDKIRAYVCVNCHAAACEPEIRDRGFEFDTITDWQIHEILDLDLERQARGNRAAIQYR